MLTEDIISLIAEFTATDEPSAEVALDELKKIKQAIDNRIVDIALEYEVSYKYRRMGNLTLDLGAAEELKGLIENEDGDWIDPDHPEYGVIYEAYEVEEMDRYKGQWMSSSAYC